MAPAKAPDSLTSNIPLPAFRSAENAVRKAALWRIGRNYPALLRAGNGTLGRTRSARSALIPRRSRPSTATLMLRSRAKRGVSKHGVAAQDEGDRLEGWAAGASPTPLRRRGLALLARMARRDGAFGASSG